MVSVVLAVVSFEALLFYNRGECVIDDNGPREVRQMKYFSLLILSFVLTVTAIGCTQEVEAPAGETPQATAPVATGSATETALASTPTLAAATETAPPTEPPASETPSPTETATVVVEPGAPGEIDEEEAILILAPGVNSRVTSPVRVAGEADPTFEQSLAVRIVTIDGETLVTEPAMIAAELGERGPFETEVAFEVAEDTQAWIQVFATSARDGGVTHLSSVGLVLAADGEADIVEATPQPERIVIDSPEAGETISGGSLTVSGRGLASFEQTLIVELLDEEGRLITSTPLIVDAPDLGQPGTFEATLTYELSGSMPARVVVTDPSPAFGGEVHVSSVEVVLEE